MKKYLLILSLLLPLSVFAQDIEERFDGSSGLEWKEYADKKTSAMIQDGCMVLTPKKKMAVTQTSVPIDVNADFTIEAELFFPKYRPSSVFGIAFPNDKTLMLVRGEVAIMYRSTQRVKVGKGENITARISLKRIGAGCTVELNGMTIGEFSLQESYTTPEITFYAGIPMHIRSLTIRQY